MSPLLRILPEVLIDTLLNFKQIAYKPSSVLIYYLPYIIFFYIILIFFLKISFSFREPKI